MPGVSLGKTCRLVRKTAKAILVATTDHGEIWVPESCVHDDSEVHVGSKLNEHGELVVNTRFAEQKGWA